MPGIDITRAWTDEEYRDSLPAETRDALPPAPDNVHELSEEQLAQAAGGLGFIQEAVQEGLEQRMPFLGDL